MDKMKPQQVESKPRNVNTGEIENWGFELETASHVDDTLFFCIVLTDVLA